MQLLSVKNRYNKYLNTIIDNLKKQKKLKLIKGSLKQQFFYYKNLAEKQYIEEHIFRDIKLVELLEAKKFFKYVDIYLFKTKNLIRSAKQLAIENENIISNRTNIKYNNEEFLKIQIHNFKKNLVNIILLIYLLTIIATI